MKFILIASLVAGSAVATFAQTPVVPTTAIANLSSRGMVGAGAGTLIAGFVIEGSAPKQVLVRGVGPGLQEFGVTNPAAVVAINVYDAAGNIVTSNSGFQNDPNADATAQVAARVGAFPLSNAGDSEVLATLTPGAYSVEIAPDAADAPDGDALLELYDADAPDSGSTIVNLSTRGEVGASAGTMISGFTVTGDASKNILIRGVGPELAEFGVPNPANGVRISVYDAQENLVASNDGGDPSATPAMDGVAAAVGAFPIGNDGSAALLVNLSAGSYTVQATATADDAADADAMIEVYDADDAMPVNSPAN